jgi:antitoxin HicB
MPKKIRQLKSMLRKTGFSVRPGKGSHTVEMDTPKSSKANNSLRKRRQGRSALSRKGSSGRDQASEETAMKCRYSLLIQWSDEDQVFVVTFPEFHRCKTHGTTYQEAAKNGEEVLELLIESYQAEGQPLPEPAKLGSPILNT